MTYLKTLHVLPCFGGDQRIIHKIELSPHSHYIIKTNKNEMIRNLEEENIIMKYRRHPHKYGYIDASRFTWTFIKTKRGEVEIEEEHINKKSMKMLPFVTCRNDERKVEVTSVSLST